MTELPPDELASAPPPRRGLRVVCALLLVSTIALAGVSAVAFRDEQRAHRQARSAQAAAASDRAARVQSDKAAARATSDAAEARSEGKDDVTNWLNASMQVESAFERYKFCLADLEAAYNHSSPADVDHIAPCRATLQALGGIPD